MPIGNAGKPPVSTNPADAAVALLHRQEVSRVSFSIRRRLIWMSYDRQLTNTFRSSSLDLLGLMAQAGSGCWLPSRVMKPDADRVSCML